jgi:alpha-galactosidase
MHDLRSELCTALILAGLATVPAAAAAQGSRSAARDSSITWLADLDLKNVEQGWRSARANLSVDGNPLRLGGKSYDRGVGSHADAIARIRLDRALRFVADVGVDDEATPAGSARPRGSVRFTFLVDGRTVLQTPELHGGGAPVHVDIPLRGARELWLLIDGAEDGIDYDHADWADARIIGTGAAPVLYHAVPAPAVALTPAAPAAPRINGARVIGAGIGHPLLFRIPATGARPIRFSAANLPAGLSVDPNTGIITGSVARAGRYTVRLGAQNARGAATRDLTIAIGQGLALTPPMGWNSWNVWGCAIDAQKIRDAADAMVSSGLVDHGWNNINIDDCWMRKPGPDARDPVTGAILSNEKFPDMSGLADYVHAKGLKLGIYIGPNERTCQDYEASIGHERADAEQFAHWGIDYVKYDWCSPKRDSVQTKYTLFGSLLQNLSRDIVYSLCEYGMDSVWTWGARAHGNLWRTTGDITDTWGSMSSIGFNQDRMAPYAGPGHWNDPDMLVVGMLGWGPTPRPTRLTPDEQYTHISLWAMLASPLLIGADMTRLDTFTLNLLTTDEVIAVNQDALGREATRVARSDGGDVYARPLSDGSWAVALFNRGYARNTMRVDWRSLKLSGPRVVRDLWRQKDLGSFADGFSAAVPPHGVVMLRVRASK